MNVGNVEKLEIEELLDDENIMLDKSEEFNIKYWSYNRSVIELFEMYRNEEIRIPSLQRDYVWTYEQASLFIDSILRGLPIPSFFVTEVAGKYLMIDGLQRLHTLFLYMTGINYSGWGKKEGSKFFLSNKSNIAEYCRAKGYEDLDETYKTKLKRSMMNIIEFSQISPSRNYSAMYQIFERINSTGRALEPQEVRNAAYYSSFNNKIIEFSTNPKYIELFNSKKEIYRTEMSVRYLAINYVYDLIKTDQFKKQLNLKNTLNQYMAIMQAKEMGLQIDEKYFPIFYKIFEVDFNIDDIIHKFEFIIDWIYEHIGKDAFKNIKSFENGFVTYKNSIQSTLAESILIAITKLYDTKTLPNINCRNKIDQLLIEERFQELIGKDTMNCERIQERIDKIIKCIGE